MDAAPEDDGTHKAALRAASRPQWRHHQDVAEGLPPALISAQRQDASALVDLEEHQTAIPTYAAAGPGELTGALVVEKPGTPSSNDASGVP